MIDKIYISITKKYIVVSIIGLLAMVITFTVVNTNNQNNNLRNQYLQNAKTLISILEVATAENLHAKRYDQIKQSINYVKKDKLIHEILIIDINRKIIVDGTNKIIDSNKLIYNPLLENAFRDRDIIWEQTKDYLILFKPIELPNMLLGAISLSYSIDDLRSAELSVLIDNIKIGIIIFIIGFIFAFIFIRKITDPIKELTKATKEVSDGNYDRQISINTKDELETLAESFNIMVNEVRISRDKMLNALNKAEASDKLKTEFLAQISHEIRTPVNAIVNFTSLLKNEFEFQLKGEAKESFEIIEQSSDRLIRTIDLILNVAEIQKGTFQPEFTRVKLLEEVIQPLIKQFQILANRKSLPVIVEMETESFILNLDKYSITQVFSNLIDNAIKYTDKGEIRITLGKEINGKYFTRITDTGIGISEEFIPFLFEPFMQEYKGYSRRFDGVGLGLALVKGFSEINNADIKVESTKEVGTTISIIFDETS